MSAIKKLNEKIIEKSELKLVVNNALKETNIAEKETILVWAEKVRETASNKESR